LARLRSWRQKASKPLVAVIVTMTVVLLALLVLIILGYIFNWPWVGLHGVTLYSWLQLLIIPAVLAVAGYVINLTISRSDQEATEQRTQSEREATEKRTETEREIALDNQREAVLQSYIDKIAELLLEKKLRESKSEEDEVRKIARVRTLTTLARLDKDRKKDVLQFLSEAGLIERDKTLIHLRDANLSGANLYDVILNGVNLYKVDLSGANLRKAHLSFVPFNPNDEGQGEIDGADLSRANLSGADLNGADLEQVELRYANLTKANLNGADLERADLHHANLTDADLSYTRLSGADLSYAELTRADLTNTELNSFYSSGNGYIKNYGADLRKANLKGATGITIEKLEKQAQSLIGATMPDGSIHP